jgi:Glyoxalase-like domain
MRGPRLQPVRIPAGPYRYTFPRSGSRPRICRSECDRCVAVQGERKPLLLLYWHAAGVIGRFEKTVMDCPDPRVLANFYCQVLGMRVNEDIDGWVVIGSEPGLRQLAFQRVTEWVPPRWPDPAFPQQLHLDIRVNDADQAEQELLALGCSCTRSTRDRLPGLH